MQSLLRLKWSLLQVFKRSLLCKQLREGVKTGRLIGDDAYKSEQFLLTPNEEKAEMTGSYL